MARTFTSTLTCTSSGLHTHVPRNIDDIDNNLTNPCEFYTIAAAFLQI